MFIWHSLTMFGTPTGLSGSADRILRVVAPRHRRYWPIRVILLLLLAGAVSFTGSIRRAVPATTGTGISRGASRATGQTLRIASFNIHSGVGKDGRRDLSRTGAVLRGFDLVALNEVRGSLLSDEGTQAAQLGRQLGLPHLFAPTERRWWHNNFGNAVLASVAIDSWSRDPLPCNDSYGFRNTLTLKTTLDGKPLHVLITHLTRRHDRYSQLQVAVERLKKLPKPAILLGDLNTPPDDPIIQAVLAAGDMTDVLGVRLGSKAAKRVDWILVRGLRVINAGIIATDASDHPCVWAEVASDDTMADGLF